MSWVDNRLNQQIQVVDKGIELFKQDLQGIYNGLTREEQLAWNQVMRQWISRQLVRVDDFTDQVLAKVIARIGEIQSRIS